MSKELEATALQQGNLNFKKIKNRFGEFEINLEKKIFFFNGLLGMPGYRNFCLTDIPNAENKTFKLFQSIDDESTAFIILPLIADSEKNYPIIENSDIELIANELGVSEANLVVLLIANFTKNGNKNDIYVNARAPIIIDAEQQAGLQYVFSHDKYDVRVKIS
jgi:flagellar assembly factor FliW